MILEIFLTIILVFCFWWLRGLLSGGGKTHSIKKAVTNHINDMAQQSTEKAWEGLSFELASQGLSQLPTTY